MPDQLRSSVPGRASRAAATSVPSSRIGVPFTSTWRTPTGCVGDEALAVGGEVADAPQRPRRDRVGVEDGDVGGLADLERAPVGRGRTRRPARP